MSALGAFLTPGAVSATPHSGTLRVDADPRRQEARLSLGIQTLLIPVLVILLLVIQILLWPYLCQFWAKSHDLGRVLERPLRALQTRSRVVAVHISSRAMATFM